VFSEHKACSASLKEQKINARCAFEGRWEFLSKKDYACYDRFMQVFGYPWFLRQFLTPAFSKQNIFIGSRLSSNMAIPSDVGVCDAKEATLVVAACGTFLGYALENINRRVPPIVYSFAPAPPNQPKWRLVDRSPFRDAESCVGKLSYRFENSHMTFGNLNNDQISVEAFNFDPKYFFSGSIKKVFDSREMKRWVAHLRDVDPVTGLPKAMAKQEWVLSSLTSTKVHRDGVDHMVCKCHVQEYDPTTGDWSRLRTRATVTYVRQGTKGS
jgi:hypothetical protein